MITHYQLGLHYMNGKTSDWAKTLTQSQWNDFVEGLLDADMMSTEWKYIVDPESLRR